MENMEKSYNRLFRTTVLCVCIAVMIIAIRTKPASADQPYSSHAEYSRTEQMSQHIRNSRNIK